MRAKLEKYAVILLIFCLTSLAHTEAIGQEEVANLLITNPPSDHSNKYSLSISIESTSKGSLCELVGSCRGVEPERSSVNLTKADVCDILSALEKTKWMFRIDKSGHRTWLYEPSSGPADDFRQWSHYFIMSFRSGDYTYYRTIPPHPEPPDETLLSSFLGVKPIRSAAIELLKQAMTGPAAESIVPTIWEEVFGAELFTQ